ncbi:MAG: SpoIIE family protein phosphatase [Deltaproteobacteria bacterium]|nr:SpoIIE family protein phosphatase [Deltaproteobacteria bacterium]
MRIGTAMRPAEGQIVSGDALLVLEGQPTTVVVADGLGHGAGAAEPAQAFCHFVRAHSSMGPDRIMSAASTEFVHSRGLAAAVLRIDVAAGKFSYCGVGNIDLHARSSSPIRPISTPGIIGRPVRKILHFDYSLTPGDILVAHTDGISSRFEVEDFAELDSAPMAAAILERLGRSYDDASCVVIRL